MNRLAQDLTYSWRLIWRTPGFTLVAVLTLALGIGANTALFSLFNGFLLRSIPVPNVDRLVAVTEIQRSRSGPSFSLTADEYRTIDDSHAAAIDRLSVTDPLIGALSGAG